VNPFAVGVHPHRRFAFYLSLPVYSEYTPRYRVVNLPPMLEGGMRPTIEGVPLSSTTPKGFSRYEITSPYSDGQNTTGTVLLSGRKELLFRLTTSISIDGTTTSTTLNAIRRGPGNS